MINEENKESLRRQIKSSLLDARFQGWEDRDCGDEWNATVAVPEVAAEADRIIKIFFPE